jgi:predicted nucleic acid-binding protein
VTGFLRLVTNPKVFSDPDGIEDALAFVAAILEAPGVELVAVGPEWPLLRERLRERGLAGNHVPDAWIAACVEHEGEHLVTFDRDFGRHLHPRLRTLLA